MRCLLLVMCTYPVAKESLTLYLARSEGPERYFGCNLMHRNVLASSHQHLMAEAPEHAGTDVVRLPYRSPNLNAYVERFVLSIKNECLERTIFFGEQSLRRAVAESIHHHHGERNHQGLGDALIEAEECVGSPHGNVRCCRRLGGLLSYYHRAAA